MSPIYNPPANPRPRGFYKAPAGAIADTYDRSLIVASQTPVSATLYMMAIELAQGQIVSNFNVRTGSTALATGTNNWMSLSDSGGVQLACTADQGLAAMAINSTFTWAVATIASGAAASYTVPSTGLYYVGMMLKGGTMPTLAGFSGNAHALTPLPAATSNTAQAGVNAFPFTAAAFTASALNIYLWIT